MLVLQNAVLYLDKSHCHLMVLNQSFLLAYLIFILISTPLALSPHIQGQCNTLLNLKVKVSECNRISEQIIVSVVISLP